MMHPQVPDPALPAQLKQHLLADPVAGGVDRAQPVGVHQAACRSGWISLGGHITHRKQRHVCRVVPLQRLAIGPFGKAQRKGLGFARSLVCRCDERGHVQRALDPHRVRGIE